MGKEKRLLLIKEAFQLAQQPHQNQAKLVVALNRTYGSVSAAARGPEPPPLPSPASLPGASRYPPDKSRHDSRLFNLSDPVRRGLRRGPLILWRRI